ncbi:MAG: hypothetical protein HY537_09195 [Deltaproteobacteria bacterium]|nr:hypothetical protein [Deltaproteobacteria bacterium]
MNALLTKNCAFVIGLAIMLFAITSYAGSPVSEGKASSQPLKMNFDDVTVKASGIKPSEGGAVGVVGRKLKSNPLYQKQHGFWEDPKLDLRILGSGL